MKMGYHQSPDGLGVHLVQMDGTPTITALLALDAGTRSEHQNENGMAHFLEHLVLRGGEKYPTPQAINQTAESLGAELNAFTSHELVAFHVIGRGEAVMPMVDLLTDFVAQPRLDSEDIERERGVVLQEIANEHDDLEACADSLMDEAAWGHDHPMGRTILGPAKHIRRFTPEQVQAFRTRRWTDGVMCLAGDLRHVDFGELDEFTARFGELHPAPGVKAAPTAKRRVLVREEETTQSYLRLQWRLPRGYDPRSLAERAALDVYVTLLGGAMSSRLFDELRERRGLCYHVESWSELRRDASELRVGCDLDPSRTIPVYERICQVVEELRSSDPPSLEEVERCKQVAAGGMARELERSFEVAASAAEEALVFGNQPDPRGMLNAYDQVTREQVCEVAEYFAGLPSVACVGDHDRSEFT